jgi:acetyl-CoA carboxylase biotin carboxyl carrier protein
MSGDRQPAQSVAHLSELREHAQLVASQMPGPLRLLRMRAGDVSIEVEWHDAGPGHGGAAVAGAPLAAVPDPGQQPGTGPEEGQELVTAPMVGTFYRAPSPGADPFVEPGDLVEAGQQIGIVEAMKLMNSVTAECTGQVTQVLAQDGQPVEFGQPLVAISLCAQDGAAPVPVGP